MKGIPLLLSLVKNSVKTGFTDLGDPWWLTISIPLLQMRFELRGKKICSVIWFPTASRPDPSYSFFKKATIKEPFKNLDILELNNMWLSMGQRTQCPQRHDIPHWQGIQTRCILTWSVSRWSGCAHCCGSGKGRPRAEHISNRGHPHGWRH